MAPGEDDAAAAQARQAAEDARAAAQQALDSAAAAEAAARDASESDVGHDPLVDSEMTVAGSHADDDADAADAADGTDGDATDGDATDGTDGSPFPQIDDSGGGYGNGPSGG
jgi:hypothetical protein